MSGSWAHAVEDARLHDVSGGGVVVSRVHDAVVVEVPPMATGMSVGWGRVDGEPIAVISTTVGGQERPVLVQAELLKAVHRSIGAALWQLDRMNRAAQEATQEAKRGEGRRSA